MREKLVVLAVLGLFVLSALDILPEPYYHQYRVNFWVWGRREIIETVEGEKSL
jgi:hypothetical protein